MPKTDLAGDPLAYGSGLGDVSDATASKAYRRVRCVHFCQIVLLAVAFFVCCTMVFCISQVGKRIAIDVQHFSESLSSIAKVISRGYSPG